MASESLAAQAAQTQEGVWKDSPYYADAEKYMERQWETLIWPRIAECDFSRVVDLACGEGRNTVKLATVAKSIVLVDLCAENLEKCRTRLRSRRKIPTYEFAQTNGAEIPCENDSVSLVYCFDAMVHFAPEVVHAYLHEIYRVLQSGGMAFLHHSNFSAADNINWRFNPHARNYMTLNLFNYWRKTAGLDLVSNDLIDWGEGPHKVGGLDCLSVLRKI